MDGWAHEPRTQSPQSTPIELPRLCEKAQLDWTSGKSVGSDCSIGASMVDEAGIRHLMHRDDLQGHARWSIIVPHFLRVWLKATRVQP